MARLIILFLVSQLCIAFQAHAENRYFLGTKTGWSRTHEVFLDGRYKSTDLFLVIGARPTSQTLNRIRNWKSRTTFGEDIKNGYDCFTEQLTKSQQSFPKNCYAIGRHGSDLFMDPVSKIKDADVLTPAVIIYKTIENTLQIGYNGIKIIIEPVVRVGFGSLVLAGSPLIKPAEFTGFIFAYSGTAIYGYTSSATGGGVMLGATGAVSVLDTATSPFVAAFNLF